MRLSMSKWARIIIIILTIAFFLSAAIIIILPLFDDSLIEVSCALPPGDVF